MQKKIFSISPRGVQQDMQAKDSPETHAFSMLNMRLVNDTNGGNFCLVNEKGNKLVDIPHMGGKVVGTCVVDKYLVLFIFSSDSYIYRFTYEDGTLIEPIQLFKGKLGFKIDTVIQTLGIVETDKLIKVYWVDGENPTRVINILDKNLTSGVTLDDTYFNFVPKLKLNEEITITKNSTGGLFPSGIIQYAFQYYKKHGQQSNLFYVSPLNYLANSQGIDAETRFNGSFNITISDIDTNFEYLRVYSIIRTTLDAEPTVKRVADLSINKASSLTFTDTGTIGDIVDHDLLLYLGVTEFSAKTLAQKDNTLFLGNIKTNEKYDINDEIQSNLKTIANGSYEVEGKEELVPRMKFYNNLSHKHVIKGLTDYSSYRGALNMNSSEITTFKYGETYRIGIQFQFETGEYSNVVWLRDISNEKHPKIDAIHNYIEPVNLQFQLPYETIKDIGAKRARLMMAVPNSTDRSVICQGIVCPTVYNLKNRVDNKPFAQASWIQRNPGNHNMPLAPSNTYDGEIQSQNYEGDLFPYMQREYFDNNITMAVKYKYINNKRTDIPMTLLGYTWEYGIYDSENNTISNKEKEGGYTQTIGSGYTDETKERFYKLAVEDFVKKTKLSADLLLGRNAWEEARAEPITKPLKPIDLTEDISSILDEKGHFYFIDNSILTFHSPDIERKYYDIYRAKDIKFRIIGIVPITGYNAKYNIALSPTYSEKAKGELQVNLNKLSSYPLWNDNSIAWENDADSAEYNFMTYMWHGTSLTDSISVKEGTQTSVLKKKIFGNVRWGTDIIYFDSPWIPSKGITETQVFNSNELTTLKIPAPANSGLSDLTYMGNIDYVITKDYPVWAVAAANGVSQYIAPIKVHNENQRNSPIRIKYRSTPHAVFAFNYDDKGIVNTLPSINETIGINPFIYGAIQGSTLWDSNPKAYLEFKFKNEDADKLEVGDVVYDEVNKEFQIKNNSGYSSLGGNSFIERYGNKVVKKGEGNVYLVTKTEKEIAGFPIIEYNVEYLDNKFINQTNININTTSKINDFLYLGELYRDLNKDTIYGGKSKEAILNNIWIPIGEFVPINSTDIILNGTQGDTYYQRWDCLKTSPFTEEDTNQVVDITSFMVESRINLDGRTDTAHRGESNILEVRPTNFNLINDVYSQTNNYFNYRIIDSESYNFSNQFTWTETKIYGEEIDSWCHLTQANVLDTDGTKGSITDIINFANDLYIFQEKGISKILFNSRAAISTTEGVPLELANSGKVDGIVYFPFSYGCQSQKQIVPTSSGIAFFDNNQESLLLFNGENVSDLSIDGGMKSWSKKISNSNFLNLFYNKNTRDIYVTTDKECLSFNESLKAFSSFYSYEGVEWLLSINNSHFQIKGISNNIWKMHDGDYNSFFGNYKPFNVDIMVNPEFQYDKVFETIEFRTGNLKDSEYNEPRFKDSALNKLQSGYYPFNKLTVLNEYQNGESIANNNVLKRKFRMWRWQLPRAQSSRARIRNPWTRIKVENNNKDFKEELRLYDMQVHYYI